MPNAFDKKTGKLRPEYVCDSQDPARYGQKWESRPGQYKDEKMYNLHCVNGKVKFECTSISLKKHHIHDWVGRVSAAEASGQLLSAF